MKIYELRNEKNNNLYNVDQLTWMRKEDGNKFKLFKEDLVCPICGVKDYEIMYLKEESYIRTFSDKHLEFCDYFGEKQTQGSINNLIKANDKKIDYYINQALHKEKNKSKLQFPKKDLSLRINKYDFNKNICFYGNVTSEFLKVSDTGIYNFVITTEFGDKINLSIGKKLSELRPNIILTLQSKDPFRLGFVSTLKRNKRFINTTIAKTNCIKIIEK